MQHLAPLFDVGEGANIGRKHEPSPFFQPAILIAGFAKKKKKLNRFNGFIALHRHL
ncbi:MAG: hypothetical protein R2791_06620 [Saprospiraceae bacterium]